MTTDPDAHTAPPVTSRPADILLVEDSPSDAAATVHALRESGAHHRVHIVGCHLSQYLVLLTLREAEAAVFRGSAGRLSVVFSGLWLVSAVAGLCFRICRRW